METKKCKECERELPITKFRVTRWKNLTEVCNECVQAKRAETRSSKRIGGGVSGKAPYSDPEFDDKQPVEVLQLMKRAKMWLEAKGYTITLKGTYTQIREVKF